jgi:hypothetical protein
MMIGPLAEVLVAAYGSSKEGESKTVALNLRKGHYAVIWCDPSRYTAGMHKDLHVT